MASFLSHELGTNRPVDFRPTLYLSTFFPWNFHVANLFFSFFYFFSNFSSINLFDPFFFITIWKEERSIYIRREPDIYIYIYTKVRNSSLANSLSLSSAVLPSDVFVIQSGLLLARNNRIAQGEGTRRHPRVGVFLSNCASTRPSCSQWRSEWQPMDSSLARLEREERREGWPGENGMQPLFRLSRARARRLCKCCSRRRNRCHSGLPSLPPFSFSATPTP